MFSIGELSKRTKVKVPTIRYYEEMGLLAAPERTEGNQRRYDMAGLERLSFIKHSRDLGFSIEAISDLIELQGHPDVRRQGFWDRWPPELREDLAHLVGLIMRRICGEASAGFRWSLV